MHVNFKYTKWFFLKEGFCNREPKIYTSENRFIPQYQFYKQLIPTSKLTPCHTSDTVFRVLCFLPSIYCIQCASLDIRYVWRHIIFWMIIPNLNMMQNKSRTWCCLRVQYLIRKWVLSFSSMSCNISWHILKKRDFSTFFHQSFLSTL